jgi:hypothetical protein
VSKRTSAYICIYIIYCSFVFDEDFCFLPWPFLSVELKTNLFWNTNVLNSKHCSSFCGRLLRYEVVVCFVDIEGKNRGIKQFNFFNFHPILMKFLLCSSSWVINNCYFILKRGCLKGTEISYIWKVYRILIFYPILMCFVYIDMGSTAGVL